MLALLATLSYPRIDPTLFRVGPVAVRWYGLAYVAGFVLAYSFLGAMIRRGKLAILPQQLSDLVGWLIAGVIIGGRLGWWIFYHRAAGSVEPWYEPIALWHGGMSFHGGLIGVVVTLIIWSRWNQISFWRLADAIALVAPIGLMLGRLANFINAELVGRPTDLPWGVIFPGETIPRHPSQIYEALAEGPILFLLLWAVARRRRSDGVVAATFLIAYGAFRFLLEFVRQPDDQLGFIAFGWLTMGQLLSAVFLGAGVVLLLLRRREFHDVVSGGRNAFVAH